MLQSDCYICKFCRRTFSRTKGYGTPNLIEHLIREHPSELTERHDLYLSVIVDECFEYKERSTQ